MPFGFCNSMEPLQWLHRRGGKGLYGGKGLWHVACVGVEKRSHTCHH